MDGLIFFIKTVLILTGLAVWVVILAIAGAFVAVKVRQWWDRANGI